MNKKFALFVFALGPASAAAAAGRLECKRLCSSGMTECLDTGGGLTEVCHRNFDICVNECMSAK